MAKNVSFKLKEKNDYKQKTYNKNTKKYGYAYIYPKNCLIAYRYPDSQLGYIYVPKYPKIINNDPTGEIAAKYTKTANSLQLSKNQSDELDRKIKQFFGKNVYHKYVVIEYNIN